VRVLLISTYELGRQPFGLAEPAAWLRRAGFEVACLDLAVEPLDEGRVRAADLIAVHLPMHTATRIALAALARVRDWNPRAHLCFYGLYAPVNAELLRARGAGTILGGEFEAGLLALAERLRRGEPAAQSEPLVSVARQEFLVPDRTGLPPLARYARLLPGAGPPRTAGYVEASRGCKHLCRHCPVVPIYGGRFRIVPREIVLADVRQQVAAGAEHVTFGDPDFLNGPAHAAGLIEALHHEFPRLTYDVTIKVEHLLRRAEILPVLRRTGCLFVTSAFETNDDAILARLAKGHTRADAERVVALCTETGLDLAPTFVPFTPWTTLPGYRDLLAWIAALGLAERVPPVQLGLRLLIPAGSRLLELPEAREFARPFDPAALAHPWSNPDPEVDRLAGDVMRIVEEGEREARSRRAIFASVWDVAWAGATPDRSAPRLSLRPAARPSPRMSEAWFCCAEPTREQVAAF
jgi:radical SAM superfamily enzyme YgiQ (UPF0313 family)